MCPEPHGFDIFRSRSTHLSALKVSDCSNSSSVLLWLAGRAPAFFGWSYARASAYSPPSFVGWPEQSGRRLPLSLKSERVCAHTTVKPIGLVCVRLRGVRVSLRLGQRATTPHCRTHGPLPVWSCTVGKPGSGLCLIPARPLRTRNAIQASRPGTTCGTRTPYCCSSCPPGDASKTAG